MFKYGDLYVCHIYTHMCVKHSWTYICSLQIYVCWATQRLHLGWIWSVGWQLNMPVYTNDNIIMNILLHFCP